ncbi:MAG TPA: TolC family protein, partial [Elusimicrobiales bacterium]|nr:TolC family protein [Elusimicrobiales bacterium]
MKTAKHLCAVLLLFALSGVCAAAELPLTMESYRELALKNNSGLRQARLAAEAADQTAKAAFTNFFPKLSATGFAANTNIAPETAIPMPFVSNIPAPALSALSMPYLPDIVNKKNTMSGAAAIVTQPVFAGGRIYNGNRLARAGRYAASQRLRLKQDEVIADSEKKYRALGVLAEKKKTLAAYSELLNSLGAQVQQAY